MAKHSREQVAIDLVVQKLGLTSKDAARRVKPLTAEQLAQLVALGDLPQANNLLASFFDLLVMERAVKEARDDDDRKARTDELVAAAKAFEAAVNDAASQVPPPRVAEAAVDVQPAENLHAPKNNPKATAAK